MSKKVLLIHGFSFHLTNTFFGKKYSNKKGFKVFLNHEKINSKMFNWGIEFTFNSWQSLNPLAYNNLYWTEKKKATTSEILEKLHETITDFEPEIIIAHSMGSFLLWNYLNSFKLDKSVNRVILIQSDLEFKAEIYHESLLQRIQDELLIIENYNCLYDPTLLLSMMVNFKFRAGQFGLKSKFVENHFFPLYKTKNLHISSISDLNFVSKIIER